MRAYDIIQCKRDGGVVSDAQLRFLINGLLDGSVSDYQLTAFLMAVYFRGMNNGEVVALTGVMLNSGIVVDLSNVPGKKADKHSTGGVGDKVSLALAPMVAACGVAVPMISGRGLGHTGGTLDKLDAVPGYVTQPGIDLFRHVVREVGCAIIGQTADLAPADKRLYAIRDVTGTVESIPLITASILSKKLAEGIDSLVLDVKCGDGAFMSRIEDARALAVSMTSIGRALGKPVQALITSMDVPLGLTVGNALEVVESVACLKGQGPADLMEVSLELAAEMLLLGGVATSRDEALDRCQRSIADGSALERFRRVVVAQGGDGRVCDEPEQVLPRAGCVELVKAERSGYLHELKAFSVGQASMLLGAGRRTAEDAIDPAAGIVLHRTVGDAVAVGDVLAELHYNPPAAAALAEARAMFKAAVVIGAESPARRSLILERLEAAAPPAW